MMSTGGRPTILIVEDVEWIRAGMRRSVEGLGCTAAEAAGPEEAAAVADREHVELILTEEELPTLDLLLALAREHPALRKAPVVIVNPDAEEGARRGEAVVLPDYERLAALLHSPCE